MPKSKKASEVSAQMLLLVQMFAAALSVSMTLPRDLVAEAQVVEAQGQSCKATSAQRRKREFIHREYNTCSY